MGTYFFAWVNPEDTTFTSDYARQDEQVFDCEIQHDEADYPTAKLKIRNPNVGLLKPGRLQWAWISVAMGDTAGPQPVFFGRVVGQPTSIEKNVIELMFRARPRDVAVQKEALAAPLRVFPYFDPVWLTAEARIDPETVLESRPLLWHYDRLSPTVSLSSIIAGEDGSETFTADDFFEGSLSFSIGSQPLKAVTVQADVSWTQHGVGELDLSDTFATIFANAGSSKPGLLSSFTGEGIYDNFPEAGANIGSGWYVKTVELQRVDGVGVPEEWAKTKCLYKEEPDPKDPKPPSGYTVKFALWQIRAKYVAGFDAERQRRERLTFTMTADVQPLWNDSEDEESETLTFSSNDVGELIDNDGTATTPPIEDYARRQYFTTDRGRRSIENLMCIARAHLIARGRAVQVTIDIPFERALMLSCRKNATIYADQIPGGVASGKIIGYSLSMNSGQERASVTIACSVGRGNAVTGTVGEDDYADDYADDYTALTGEVLEAVTGELTYVPPTDPPVDDGVDFSNMTPSNCVVLAEMMQGGETSQRTILAQSYRLVADAVEALNNDYTRFRVVLRPLAGKTFEQTYNIEVSQQMIPKTIDLEAA